MNVNVKTPLQALRMSSRLQYRARHREQVKKIDRREKEKRRRRGTRGCANGCAVHRVRVLASVYTFARLRSGKRKGTAERASERASQRMNEQTSERTSDRCVNSSTTDKKIVKGAQESNERYGEENGKDKEIRGVNRKK